jgi:hypothetical protein
MRMYSLELHYLFAKVTLLLLLAAMMTGIMLILGKLKRWYRSLLIAHIATSVLTLLFFLLTYLLAPRI